MSTIKTSKKKKEFIIFCMESVRTSNADESEMKGELLIELARGIRADLQKESGISLVPVKEKK